MENRLVDHLTKSASSEAPDVGAAQVREGARAIWEVYRTSPIATATARETSFDDLERYSRETQKLSMLLTVAHAEAAAAFRAIGLKVAEASDAAADLPHRRFTPLSLHDQGSALWILHHIGLQRRRPWWAFWRPRWLLSRNQLADQAARLLGAAGFDPHRRPGAKELGDA